MPTPPPSGASADSPRRRLLVLPCQKAAREMRRFNTLSSSSSSLSSSSPSPSKNSPKAATSQPPSSNKSNNRPISIRHPFPAPRQTITRPPPRPPPFAAAAQTFQSKTAPIPPPAKTPSPGLGVPSASASGGSSRQAGDSPADQQSETHKFFYASDAKAVQRPLSVPQKPVAFFYANGESAEAKPTTSPSLNQSFTPVLPPTQEPVATKFFYANGTPDPPPSRHALATSASASALASALSTNSRPLVRPRTSSSATGLVAPATQRPVSPIRTAAPSATQPLSANPPLPPSPTQPLSLQSSPALAPVAHSSGRRKVSIDTASRLIKQGHSRTGSASTVTSRFAASPSSSQPASPPQSPGLMQPALTMASLIQAAEEWKGRDGDRDAQPELSQSPTRSSHAGEPISELVANARRERKVQDLEITNASLEAINRTLERQLRKQTIELRRYRRMSRAGHISLVSSRVPSAALTDAAMDLSGVDEEEEATEDEQDEYLDSLDESDFSSNESLSADVAASPNDKLVARRKRDELRLQIDLTKHQELLVDSQKMNQSLKRCLDWTEVLIKEGQKALAYDVRVSDVDFGGRVLTPLDEDEDDEDGPRPGPPRTKGSQDRDSGIELPGDGG
ncbi:hypothetical protein OCS_04361 [Ophiocordyceps sinensis CO18]|uniref:Uncharacterized protein n=1 Tax=Ophiocordyceps sinensis (strain Co18 / CGMCC 3.14243) TaxID=911162 RepID=T5ADK6_OPHSC|nr:hypothetical protein OCS_04361 [Ophiocordyceps sinensis CO18]